MMRVLAQTHTHGRAYAYTPNKYIYTYTYIALLTGHCLTLFGYSG